ncbi:hypothetical protein PML78_12385 [Enterococcus dispar]|uniref:hypothetical protein n=1 Tax=Enterococcus dispar TaxID=44009 RepID=UPI0023309354|nr:hypothetical protein [Enterococcus dispar]WCG32972.1 hypothetical protein PML78_12385 [Enterococcus dispar]
MFEKQTLGDLNGYLFEQLERLNDPDLTQEELEMELNRSKAIVSVSNQIVNNGNLVLSAQRFYDNRSNLDIKQSKMLSSGEFE